MFIKGPLRGEREPVIPGGFRKKKGAIKPASDTEVDSSGIQKKRDGMAG
jgi:hypothetical protein